MTVWHVPPVERQPVVELVQWGIAQVESGGWHLLGYHAANREGRASSRIVRYDRDSLTGITASGRVYHLIGPPGPPHEDVRYVFECWCVINKTRFR